MPACLRRGTRPLATLLTLIIALVGALTLGAVATANGAGSGSHSAVSAARGTVAHNAKGKMTSTVTGTTKDGRKVTGTFTPTHFKQANGKEWVRGVLRAVVTNADGTQQHLKGTRTMRVKSINGNQLSRTGTTAAAMSCDILHLTLAPLDLDLLGLQIHLDRVVLNIVAATGAGNLLGNLLCSITGLLDGGPLGGLLGHLTDLLNQILGALGLGT